jgi:hypothetical protein
MPSRDVTLSDKDNNVPLSKGSSQKSFVKNIKTELAAGKPMKQSLAIAYAMKRKRKKMAAGGEATQDSTDSPETLEARQSVSDSFKGALGHAKGGMIEDNYQPSGKGHTNPDYYEPAGHMRGEMESGHLGLPDEHERPNEMAMREAGKKLNQHPVDMHAETSMEEQDLVDRIMELRSKTFENEARLADGGYVEGDEMYPHPKDKMFDVTNKYSEGGKVANSDEIEAGFDPNEFDVLHLEDDLKSTYGDDDNAGDSLGNKGEDARRSDLVDRIMLKNFKQKYPRGYPGR